MILYCAALFILVILWNFIGKFRPSFLLGPFVALLGFALFTRHFFELALPWGVLESISWRAIPELHFAFRGDTLSFFFGALVVFSGALISFYAIAYFNFGGKELRRFLQYFFFFQIAMLGVVFSNNLILLFIFWELTSVSSFLLIGFKHQKEGSRQSALQALLVTGIGGLCLLGGILLLGFDAGTFDIAQLIQFPEKYVHALSTEAMILIFLGVFSKSAQFPFHFWLPNAMTAPTPASSYLHSATMVKAGIFLLMRLYPLLSFYPAWEAVTSTVGWLTFVVCAFLCLLQTDLKAVLAYTTTSALGMIVFSLSFSEFDYVAAGLAFLWAHAFYKAPMFLLAGNIEKAYGTRDLNLLGGVRKQMPRTFWAFLPCALAMASLPPFFSFLAKEELLEALLLRPWWQVTGFVFAAIVFVWVPFRWLKTLFGGSEKIESPKKILPVLDLIPFLFGVLSLLALWNHGEFFSTVVSRATVSLTQVESSLEFHFWHGWKTPLFLSLLSAVGGFVLAQFWGGENPLAQKLKQLFRFGPYTVYRAFIFVTKNWSPKFFALIQNGRLNLYVCYSLAFLLFLFIQLLGAEDFQFHLSLSELGFFEIALGCFIILGALMAPRANSNLASLTVLGVVGFGVALLFMINGAPDLALTQFLIESLSLVLLVLTFKHLPKSQNSSSLIYRLVTGGIAGFLGLYIGAIAFHASETQAPLSLSHFFSEKSLIAAHGRNVVNVILVDFRAIDTLGEIMVLCLALVGVLSLLRWRLRSHG